MNRHIVLAGLLSVLCAGCSDTNPESSFGPVGVANAAAIPSFLQEGKWYGFEGGAGLVPIFVVTIDKESGWIKVRNIIEKEKWYNTAQISTLQQLTLEEVQTIKAKAGVR